MGKPNPNPLPELPRLTKAYHKSLYPYLTPSRPELSVHGKTLFITGGAGGLGRIICDTFAQAGISNIIMVGRTLTKLEDAKRVLLAKYPTLEITLHAVSVTDFPTMSTIIRAAGRIDILVNAAGVCHNVGLPSALAPADLVEMFQTNTVGAYHAACTAIHEHAIRGDEHELKVINLTSALSHTHIAHLSGYAASKAASNLLMLHLSMQWRARRVGVFSMCPVLSYTGMTGKVFPPESPIWEDATLSAGFCLWLCHPEAAFLSGKFLWAQWDVPELLEKKAWIEEQPWNLEIGLVLPSMEMPGEGSFIVDERYKNVTDNV